jgi:cation diffusion facilitator CzcD-associated flavoprotein CzcO
MQPEMQQFDAIVVGAGFGGIGAAIQLRRLGYDNICIIDREDGLGGTWHVNRYPGLTVDVPATTYSYWFEPNPHWSRLYAPGVELKRYAEHVADKYDVRGYMRFNVVVETARWHDDARHWRVTLAGGETLHARFLVAATGLLSRPQIPDIPGIDTFAGRVIHTADWDPGYSLHGRRAAVIGTGATAVQVIPELADAVRELTVYQRTPIWVMPKLDIRFPPAARRLFAKQPLTQRILRRFTDTITDVMMVVAMWKFRFGRPVNVAAAYLSRLHRLAAVRDVRLWRALDPDYDFGCKRPTMSNSYFRALAHPHVHVETTGIDRIEPDGIVDATNTKRLTDTLVLATGFDVWDTNLPAIEVIGRDGRDLRTWWRENGFRSYQGLSVPHFPNFLSMTSPYSWVGFSWFNTIECQMRHMNRLLGELQRRGAGTFEVTEHASDEFCDRMSELLGDSVFYAGNCATSRSYYIHHSGQAPLFRPTSVRNAVGEQDRFPLHDYAMS